ncbi:putative nrps-t1pks biosynthetic cluster [Epichloe bromicola]|uniref:Nrps-t1pks biosynthetic cluster n=1 Tax=Epichloe bromicola TaxID=79588 RepID=A0ABQ0CXH1_9HYPO
MINVVSVLPGKTCGRFPDGEDPVADVILKSALDEALDAITSHMYSVSDFSSVHINDAMDDESPLDALTIVDWGADSVKVIIQPAQTDLKPDRSYWLVGLSGSMGLSLADWMIDHGASNLVISSRRPNISKDWLDAAARRGAGDLLLRDKALDFFVFFSPLATVAGNPGQASYTAANAFMSGLAQQRHRRGAAASVMDLGPVIGTGVITRGFGHDVSAASADRGLVGVSELDVHQLFPEAINSKSAPNRPLWYDYPQFACFTLQEVTAEVNSPDSFTRELCKMLRLGDDYDLETSLRTDELGLDSLVAVRVRSWFLNNFHVNIPALRILMGASIQDLILQALEGIPPEVTPMVSAGRSPDSESDKLVPNKSSQSSLRSMDGGDSENGVTPPSTYAQTEAMPVEDTPLPSPSPGSAKHDEMKLQRTGQVSFTQSVFLFVHELLKDKSTLNNTGMLHLKGEIRISDLSRAVRTMGTRHEALRTCIRVIDGRISLGVLQSSRLVLEHQKIRTPDEMIKVYAALRNHIFDLSSGHTSRVILLSLSPKDHFLFVASHHIIFDRTSTGIFLKDLERMYDGGVRGTPDPLQYLDYSNTQYKEYESGHWKRNIEFWRAEFCTISDPLPLHRSQVTDRRPLEQYASHIIDFRVDQKLSDRIRQLARDHKLTSCHVYLAAFGVLLHRSLGVKDVCIGIADSCRTGDRTLTGVGPLLK